MLFKHKSNNFLWLKLSQCFHPTAWVVTCGCWGGLTVELGVMFHGTTKAPWLLQSPSTPPFK